LSEEAVGGPACRWLRAAYCTKRLPEFERDSRAVIFGLGSCSHLLLREMSGENLLLDAIAGFAVHVSRRVSDLNGAIESHRCKLLNNCTSSAAPKANIEFEVRVLDPSPSIG